MCTRPCRTGRWTLLVALMIMLPTSFPSASAVAAADPSADPAAVAGPTGDQVPRFEPAKCGFALATGQREGVDVNCGYVVVRERHDHPDGPTIRLAVARFRSLSATPAPEPIVYLEGGPGGAALGPATGDFAARFTATHDYLTFDQRGVGQSQPALSCPEVTAQESHELGLRESIADQEAHLVDSYLRCHDRLAAKYDLAAYTTAENAADVDDIRSALGYGRIDLLGISYGSRLALTVLRDFPQIVASAAIDGVSPPQADNETDYAVTFDRALAQTFAACAADPACAAAFPDVKADFRQAVAALDADPLTITTGDGTPGDAASPALVLTGGRLVEFVHGYLYAASEIRYLPALFAQLKNRDPTLFRALLRDSSGGGSITQGMAISVRCSDYVPFGSREQAERAGGTTLPEIQADYLPSVLAIYPLCARWGSPPQLSDNRAVASDIPTLVLASANDPITPPSYARSTVQALAHGVYVEAPGLGHSVIGNSGACGAKLVLDFFARPGIMPETGCIAALQTPFLTNVKRYAAPPPLTIDPAKKYVATMVTSEGTIVIDLLAGAAPLAVNNLAFLAGDHFFDGMDFFGGDPSYGVGTGDPTGLGQGGPGYTFKDEPIPANLDYERGTLIMLNDGPDTNGSRFAILSADLQGTIKKRFTIFGKVTVGMEVVDRIIAWRDGDGMRPTIVTMTVQVAGAADQGNRRIGS